MGLLKLALAAVTVSQAWIAATALPNEGVLARDYDKSVVNQTVCDNKKYIYRALAGYGLVPTDARDKFGDTIGGIGSSIALDRTSWKKLKNGSYTGILWTLPDRGW